MNALQEHKGAIRLLVAVVVLGMSGTAYGNDVLAGHDLWTTPPGGAVEDFGGSAVPPLPADFFGPGSDPFVGVVNFTGEPIPSFDGQPTGGADTIVERQANAILPGNGSSDTVPIEIVALSLVSTEPITVTFNGGQNPTEYDVHVELSGAPSLGSMQINQQTAEGGSYSASLNVCPIFTFTQVGNPGNTVAFDYCLDVNPAGRPLSVTGQPWQFDLKQPQNSPLSGPNFVVVGATQHTGPHPVAEPVELAANAVVPTTSQWGLLVLAMLLGLGGVALVRRRLATTF
jgi:hypothetical protein